MTAGLDSSAQATLHRARIEEGGALLINKHAGVSSFGLIEQLQQLLLGDLGGKRRELPKMGHGGTLDPFATGLLVVCIGRGVKLARYFLGSDKVYEGRIRFGESTIPGDPTAEINERSDVLPRSLEQLREVALGYTKKPYLQTPPMHSAKKKDGKPLYELAREGIEIEREPRSCTLYSFDIKNFEPAQPGQKIAHSNIQVACSAGTYIRTLTQDYSRSLGTVGLLETLHRSASGSLSVDQAMSLEEIHEATQKGQAYPDLKCWVPFDRLLADYDQAIATESEAQSLIQGKQYVLPSILQRTEPAARVVATHADCVAIYDQKKKLVAVARKESGQWGIERVFTQG